MDTSECYEQLIYDPQTHDLAEFKELAAAAKDAGFTHVYISGLSERTDYQGDDKDSPWCEWSIISSSFFKHVTPDGLEDAFPADFVQRQMDFMKAKHKIAAKLGLKAAYFALEPHWLSERVYAKHPAWRGSRCDNSLRTTGMFFAPDVDHPEVRELYRLAAKEIVTECPLIDTFIIFTNDSGAGFPWAGRLYVNANGPTGTQNKDMGLRVVEFLKTLRQGAADGGSDTRVFTAARVWFTPGEADLVLRSLEPGIGVTGGGAPAGLEAECSLSNCGGWGDQVIDKFPSPMSVVSGVANIKNSKTMRFQSSGNAMDYFTAFKVAMDMPAANTVRQKLDVLARMAAELYADDVVDEVLDAWYALQRARTQESTGGIRMLAPIMLRWLVRPLVPHQELLTEEERSYWEPYIYQSQASQPESYLDYLNWTGQPIAATWAEAKFPAVAINGIESTLKSAAAFFEKARDKTASDTAREKLQIEAYRVRARICVILTIHNTLGMGSLIYERDRDPEKFQLVDPDMLHLPQGSLGDHGLFFMHRILRWELDNMNELISLLEASPVPLIRCEQDKSQEGALIMGPDVLDGLKKKVRIMLKYWRTAEKGYYLPTKGG